MPLSAKKTAFVSEYLVDLSATHAAVRAGYSPRTARSKGHALKTEPAIAAAIAVAMAERSKRTGITADRVLREYARIAFADIRSVTRWGPDGLQLVASDDLSADDAAAIVEVSETTQGRQRTLKAKLASKDAALRMLALHCGLGGGNGEATEDIGADTDPPVAPD